MKKGLFLICTIGLLTIGFTSEAVNLNEKEVTVIISGKKEIQAGESVEVTPSQTLTAKDTIGSNPSLTEKTNLPDQTLINSLEKLPTSIVKEESLITKDNVIQSKPDAHSKPVVTREKNSKQYEPDAAFFPTHTPFIIDPEQGPTGQNDSSSTYLGNLMGNLSTNINR